MEEGIRQALETGVLAGYEVVDVKVTLTDGSYHEVDSSEMAFKIAGSMAVKEAAKRAKPVLLEPMMKVEVVVPEEFMGSVTGIFIRAGDEWSRRKTASVRPLFNAKSRFRKCSAIPQTCAP